MLDSQVHALSVDKYGGDVDARFVDRLVSSRLHLAAQRDDVGAIDDRIAELSLARTAEDEARRAAVVDAELRAKSVARLLLSGEFEHQRMHAQFDASHLL